MDTSKKTVKKRKGLVAAGFILLVLLTIYFGISVYFDGSLTHQ